MDRTLLSRPRRHRSSSSKKKKHGKHRRHRDVELEDPEEDVMDVRVPEGVKVNKGEAGPRRVIEDDNPKGDTSGGDDNNKSEDTGEDPAPGTEGAPPLEVKTPMGKGALSGDNVMNDNTTNDQVDSVNAADILKTAEPLVDQPSAGKSKRRDRGGNGGDFGAAYNELYTQLCIRMVNRIHLYFQRVYNSTGGSSKKFKKKLEDIQKWNQSEINRRAKEILQVYPGTEAYFRYAYAANVMLMSVVIQKNEDSNDVEIEVPKFSEFILKSYIESARVLYDNAGVLDPALSDRDKLRVREELKGCFAKAISTALRMMVPLEAIAPGGGHVGEKFDAPESESEVSEEEDSESESESESESGSEESGSEESESEESYSGSEGSESGTEESYSEGSGSESDFEEEEPVAKNRKRVKASRRSLQTPDALSIDQQYY